MPTTATQQPLKLNFKDDTLTTVSRDALKAIARKLGFNETQTVLYALARLRDEVLAEEDTEKLLPLTRSQHQAIAKAEPKGKGRGIGSLRGARRTGRPARSSATSSTAVSLSKWACQAPKTGRPWCFRSKKRSMTPQAPLSWWHTPLHSTRRRCIPASS